MKKIKIICTLGPSSFKRSVLKQLKYEGVNIFRINLSHTNLKDISKKIDYLKKNNIKNICIDTEGAQLRTTKVKKKQFVKKSSFVKIYNKNRMSNHKNIYLYPKFNILSLRKKSKINIGFNDLQLEVKKKNILKRYLFAKVIKPGYLESKKGVHINHHVSLPSLTEKDKYALKLAREKNIKYFAVSFANKPNDIIDLKKIVGKKVFIISKIETLQEIKNLKKIANQSNALLIDRGDLSRYIPVEKIPIAQDYIIKLSKKFKKPTYVATNLLETMVKQILPTRAESNDIHATLKQGASGLVLAAETAIGSYPIDSVKFLKRCIYIFKYKRNFF